VDEDLPNPTQNASHKEQNLTQGGLDHEQNFTQDILDPKGENDLGDDQDGEETENYYQNVLATIPLTA
jgi:hypothetical protein